MSLAEALAQGLQALHLELPPDSQQKLVDYVALIEKWNRVYNLTAVREPEKMLSHHILDSLAIAPHVSAPTLADVGSGAGLPGIPLALAYPASAVTLIESNHKKSAFLKQAVIELELANVSVETRRVEAWEEAPQFDCVVSRAFSDLGEFVTLASRLCAREGTLAAMKGVHPYDELAQIPVGFRVERVIPLEVPGLRAERHLVLVKHA